MLHTKNIINNLNSFLLFEYQLFDFCLTGNKGHYFVKQAWNDPN
jgi:hypothetical protein